MTRDRQRTEKDRERRQYFRIEDAVRHILTLKFELGLFRNPFGKCHLAGRIGAAMAEQAVIDEQQ